MVINTKKNNETKILANQIWKTKNFKKKKRILEPT
jgi:hypothetical protein